MPWPSWDQAAIVCAAALVAWVAIRRLQPGRLTHLTIPALLEVALISGLYSIWRIARQLPFTHEAGAIDRARALDHLQQRLHLPSEIGLQHFAVNHEAIARFINAYYAILHVPALIVFLVWMWICHRDKYPHWRSGLVYVTLGCLIIRFLRVAPPRFVPELGFVDLSDRLGFKVYGKPGTGISDQYAAMPSIHVAWAAVVALGVLCVATGWWRWLVFLHLPITMYVVAATGHHWWFDGAVALLLLWSGLAFDTWWRRRASRPATNSKSSAISAAPSSP